VQQFRACVPGDPRRIIGAMGLDVALTVERQLLPEKEILCGQLRS
jgi:hypothetical protein